MQNPQQLDKKFITNRESVLGVKYSCHRYGAELMETLSELEQASHAQRAVSVLLLGRYNNSLEPYKLAALNREYPHLSINFMTVHKSKGQEADHVILLTHAESRMMGFPCEIVDDPILNLVLPAAEEFEHAEERRLFYVALTRAKLRITILADWKSPSVFVRELCTDPEYGIKPLNTPERCRECDPCTCGIGCRVERKNKRTGDVFLGCDTYPVCKNTISKPKMSEDSADFGIVI